MHKMHTKPKLSLSTMKRSKRDFYIKVKKSNLNNSSHHSKVLPKLLPLYKEESSDQLSLCPCFLPEQKTVRRDFYWMTDFFLCMSTFLQVDYSYFKIIITISHCTSITSVHRQHHSTQFMLIYQRRKGSYIVDIWCAHASADVSCFGRECFFDCNCLCRRTEPT